MSDVVQYWMLDDPESGTLVRRLSTGRFESYIQGRWEDHTPELLWITMAPDSGDATAVSVSEANAVLRRQGAR